MIDERICDGPANSIRARNSMINQGDAASAGVSSLGRWSLDKTLGAGPDIKSRVLVLRPCSDTSRSGFITPRTCLDTSHLSSPPTQKGTAFTCHKWVCSSLRELNTRHPLKNMNQLIVSYVDWHTSGCQDSKEVL